MTTRTASTGTGKAAEPVRRKSRLWLWVWLAFALQIAAWVAWLKIASQHRVEDVPLVTAPKAQSSRSDSLMSAQRGGSDATPDETSGHVHTVNVPDERIEDHGVGGS